MSFFFTVQIVFTTFNEIMHCDNALWYTCHMKMSKLCALLCEFYLKSVTVWTTNIDHSVPIMSIDWMRDKNNNKVIKWKWENLQNVLWPKWVTNSVNVCGEIDRDRDRENLLVTVMQTLGIIQSVSVLIKSVSLVHIYWLYLESPWRMLENFNLCAFQNGRHHTKCNHGGR